MDTKVEKFEKNVLHFAAVTMAVLAILFAGAMCMFYWDVNGTHGKEIFDRCTTVLPPIATLVLGYYFGRHQPTNMGEVSKSDAHAEQAIQPDQV